MQKARDNLAAIRIVKDLATEKRLPTEAERDAMAKYVGWGGLANAFDQPKTGKPGKGFEAIGAELKGLLTPDEYAAAGSSTQFAHYTSEKVIRAMWKAVQDMGFKGGQVFEPGMGVGHFKGMMPAEIARRSKYHGLELDTVSAQIAKALYPFSNVREADLTQTPIPDHSYDLAIGNPPFSDVRIKSDPRYKARNFVLHDYFFAKSLDALRPGGLMAYVTSAGTMNKLSAKAREYMAQRAEFVGGVRLPSSAFKQNAGTEVTTDILFFKKRAEPLDAKAAPEPWTETVNRRLPDASGGTTEGAVNRYFSEHPEQVLGEEGFFDKLHLGNYGVHPIQGRDLATDLTEALDRLPKNIAVDPGAATQAARDLEATENKNGSFYVKDGKLMRYYNGAGTAVPKRNVKGGKSAEQVAVIKGLLPIRDALREALLHDSKDNPEAAKAARVKLNAAYDAFVAKHGPINEPKHAFFTPTRIQQEKARAEAREEARDMGDVWDEGSFDPEALYEAKATMTDMAKARTAARDAAATAGNFWDEGSFRPDEMDDVVRTRRPNLDPMSGDPEMYRLSAIEEYDEAEGTAKKGDVFFGDTTKRETEPDLKGANDGVLWSLNKFGGLNVDAIAQQMGRSREWLVHELGDRVYPVPGSDQYETAEQYLSGDIYDKLDAARAAALTDPSMERNVAALEKVRPTPIPPSKVIMTLGMPWIPADDVQTFGRDKLHLGNVGVSYNAATGGWRLTAKNLRGARTEFWQVTDERGTVQKTAEQVLLAALNNEQPKITMVVGSGDDKRTVTDEVATESFKQKIEQMREEFDSFTGDPERSTRLAKLYNDTMNRVVNRKPDGDYLTTPGIANWWKWRPHQTSFIARVIQMGNTYLAHAVGAGKTSAMIGAGMEMKRLGLIQKPMYVVPNHMLGQFAKEFYEQYPAARIAVADDTNFDADERKQFIADVANRDLDAIIIKHSAFSLIPTRPETQAGVVKIELDRLLAAYGEEGKGLDRYTKKDLENKISAMREKLKGAMQGKKDSTYYFEEMGVDHLFIDEAHLFRKLMFASRQTNIKGVAKGGSARAFDLYAKLHYLESRNPGHSAVLASGTPVTNTMGELYTISRYLQQPALERLGLGHFDAWAGTFGRIESELEQDATGRYVPTTRFRNFVNVPELYKMVAQVMDVVNAEQLGEIVTLPKLKGGERIYHVAPETPWLKANRADFVRRAAVIKERGGRKVEKGEDILLSIINDGRRAAVDPRLVNADLPSDPNSKLNQMIASVAEIYHRTGDVQFYDPKDDYKTPTQRGRATQMVFSDIGVNPTAKSDFSSYDWMRKELVRLGVPREQIKFIRDFKNPVAKQRLFNDMNEGKVAVLIGSVDKMGVGTNAQKRLYALHGVDPYWYPANDTQRAGRILRQGNGNPEVEVHNYTTAGSYDEAMWTMMATKAGFIEKFFRGDPDMREMEDVGEASLFAQLAGMTASDPRVLELANVKKDLTKLQRRAAGHERDQWSLGAAKEQAERDAVRYHEYAADTAKDVAQRVDTRGDAFRLKINGQDYAKRADAAAALAAKIEMLKPSLWPGAEKPVFDLGGFSFIMRRENRADPTFSFERVGAGGKEHLGRFMDRQEDGSWKLNVPGLIQSAEHHIATLDTRQASYANRALAFEQQARDIAPQLGQEFPGFDEIARLRDKRDELEYAIQQAANAEPEAEPQPEPETPAQAHDRTEQFASFGHIGEEPREVRDARSALMHGLSGSRMNTGLPMDLIVPAVVVTKYWAQHLAGPQAKALMRKGGDIAKAAGDVFPMRAARGKLADSIEAASHEARLFISPMADGSRQIAAKAKTFANNSRALEHHWRQFDADLVRVFPSDRREAMWSAADEESVIRQQNASPVAGAGKSALAPHERDMVEAMQARAQMAFETAQELGMTDAEALPSYVPRMVVAMTGGGPRSLGGARGEGRFGDANGGNLYTTTPNLRFRKHLETEETEAAAQQIDPRAVVVRDIRTLALATMRLEQAILGRTLVNSIKDFDIDVGMGHNGGPALSENEQPGWRTIDHPALRTWKIGFTTNDDGKTVPRADQRGQKMFTVTKMRIHPAAYGPLKAVLSTRTGMIVRGLQAIKAKQMSVIMISPLLHNVTIAARSFPADPAGVVSLLAYRRGYAVKTDPVQMGELIAAGLQPMGRRTGARLDVNAIVSEPDEAPGQSWTAQVLSAPFAGLDAAIKAATGKDAINADAVRRAVDFAGHWWHDRFLWDQIANLQAGLAAHMIKGGLKAGLDRPTAVKTAADLANLYAGALPMEAMSHGARIVANIMLFSRSYTLGNLAMAKRAISGLPSEVRAQILHDGGPEQLEKAQSFTKRKALATFAVDFVVQKVLQAMFGLAAFWLVNTVRKMLGRHTPTPPFEPHSQGEKVAADALGQLGMEDFRYQAPVAPMEKGKEDKFLIGRTSDGTAITGSIPLSRYIAEMEHWEQDPTKTTDQKLSPWAKLSLQVASNRESPNTDFGGKYYNTPGDLPGKLVWDATAGGVIPKWMVQGGANALLPTDVKAKIAPGMAKFGYDMTEGRTVGALELGLPMLGMSVSHGAPGGPVNAAAREIKQQHEDQISEALKGARGQLANGDEEGARATLRAQGFVGHQLASELNKMRNPATSYTRGRARQQNRYMSPDQKSQMEQAKAVAAALAARRSQYAPP